MTTSGLLSHPSAMRRAAQVAYAIAALAMVVAVGAAHAEPLPRQIGQCSETTIASVTPGGSGRGSAVSYANGGRQTSDDAIAVLAHARRGDKVRLCLIDIPYDCPPADRRGKIYRATNLRTGETWDAGDWQHCGGV